MGNVQKTDAQLHEDVVEELKWDPGVTAEHILVTANSGVVTLRGSVPYYFEKITAEKAAQRVGGARAVVDEIEVSLLGAFQRSDEDIARAAVVALDSRHSVPAGVQVAVDRAWVTIRGDAEWNYQRTAAMDAVSQLVGVRGVSNEMTLNRGLEPTEVQADIEAALKRCAQGDGRHVDVRVDGGAVTLSGTVQSFAEMEDARRAAWSCPGVRVVKNHLSLRA